MLLFRCKMIKVMHYLFLSRLFVPIPFIFIFIIIIFFTSVLIYNRKDKLKQNSYVVITNIVA